MSRPWRIYSGDRMLSFDYAMELDFEGGEAGEHAFTLRCLPQERESQHIDRFQLVIEPETKLSYGTDSFGNRYGYGVIHESHRRFRAEASGLAERFPDRHETASAASQMLYRQFTEKTRPGNALRAMFRKLQETGNTGAGCDAEADPFRRAESLQTAIRIRDLVHDTMEYVPGATNPVTSAEEAAGRGKGVCQDYAHIMLALCRMCGISCRYTAGLLIGEGASHAWVEVCDGGKWVEFDPTNPDAGPEERLIFSHGRDAEDCEINRGIYIGPGAQIQKVSALVAEQ